jgi:hypothetical protein
MDDKEIIMVAIVLRCNSWDSGIDRIKDIKNILKRVVNHDLVEELGIDVLNFDKTSNTTYCVVKCSNMMQYDTIKDAVSVLKQPLKCKSLPNNFLSVEKGRYVIDLLVKSKD